MTFSIKKIAERYGVGQHTVLGWIRAGEMQAVNVGRMAGSRPHWRVTVEATQAFEVLRASQPTTDRPRRQKRSAAAAVKFY